MASFTANTVKTRYTAAGSIPILKNDLVNICNDLIQLETFGATASDQVGKWSKLILAAASTGASSLLSGGAVSEISVTPATNIPLHHLDVGSLAATGSTNRGRWKAIILAETTGVQIQLATASAFPNTNLQIRDLSNSTFLETSTDGHWKALSLGFNQVSSSNIGGLPFTNIGIRNLNGAVVRLNTTFQTSGSMVDTNTTPRMIAMGNISSATSAGSSRYHLMSVFLSAVSGTSGVSVDYMYGMGGTVTGSAAATAYFPMVLIKCSGADGVTQISFQVRVIEIGEI